ncbi:Hypothetical predicted protein [Mytilus galloprovincialis]|uniref:Uncharacterized protein n=1 Tax=Mytilus galloprovincialis TaxID=29158 RepID=A0A8B6HER2_MYTGA|nr:Hypothetical predicted protein [Mytilus galloprovincialis]
METEENIDGACIFSPAASTSRITTRSEWYSCIFCKNKTYKKDAKLHKVESEDRIKNILEAARINSDHEIESTVLHENFTENALDHSACITKYLLKTPQKLKAESSDHDTAFVKLGGFHTLSCFIACIGKLWADGGLRDLMVDSGVYAGCTVDQMLLGKQFNRSVRGLTLVYEALRSLWFASFFKWCEENDGI